MLPLLIPAIVMTAAGTIADRVVVSVGTDAITLSEVREEVAVTAFLNGEKPDFSPSVLRHAADRLVDQALIRREMALGRYPAPSADVAASMLANLVKTRGGRAAFEKELKIYDITREELLAHLQWQAALIRFIEVRFRPAVQVTSDDIQKYFQQHYATRTEQGKPVSLESVRDQIEEQMTGERADEQLDQWLKDTRKQTPIVYRADAVGPEAKP